jgi:hypothetical protein
MTHVPQIIVCSNETRLQTRISFNVVCWCNVRSFLSEINTLEEVWISSMEAVGVINIGKQRNDEMSNVLELNWI